MRGFKYWGLLALVLGALASPAHGQTLICFKSASGTGCTPVSAGAPLPVNATVSASVSGFAPASTGTPISVTTGGVTGTLPAGTVVAAFNVGATNTAYCKLGASATTSDIAIPPNSWFAFTVGAATQLTCITSTSTTTVNMVGGSGLPTGAGGGGGGSGGTVTQGNAGTNAQAWWMRIGDATSGPAKVQAGNAAATTDVAVTVADPNVLAAVQSAIPGCGATPCTNHIGAVEIASGGVASGAVASGAFASGSIASGAIASGAVASGAIASGAFAAGSFLNATAGDPCMFQAKSNAAFSSASGTFAIVTGVSAKKIYICSLLLVAPSAVSVSLAEGSSSTCGTSNQAAVVGVATSGTAANGVALAANTGWTFGNGGGTVAQTATAANYLCVYQSGTAQLAGNITYVQQ